MTSTGTRVAVVTGANKGIGLEVVKLLCAQFNGDVILTARDEGRGGSAVQELAKEGMSPKFHQLDISDVTSRERLRDFLKTNYGGLDVLVNNAGILPDWHSPGPLGQQVEEAVRGNYQATRDTLLTLLPLLRPHARVVNVSSMASLMALICCSPELQARLKAFNTMSVKDIDNLMEEAVQAAQAGQFQERGWPAHTFVPAYSTSKMGIDLLTFVLQRQMNSDPRKDIILNAVCPGRCKTDMSQHIGNKTAREGADTPVYCALLPPNTTSPKGDFVSEREVKDWRLGVSGI